MEASANILAGDTLTVGTGGRKELVTVKSRRQCRGQWNGHRTGRPRSSTTRQAWTCPTWERGSVSRRQRSFRISGDAVQALGSGITIDRPLVCGHGYGAPVVQSQATTVGYQGPPAPNQWFGGALSTRAGSIALMDSGAVAVVDDAVVYGSQQSSSSGNGTIASPELATLEGDQGEGGCIAVVPGPSGGAGRSRGRFPDGFDADRNCTDFLTQAATSLPLGAGAGATSIKAAERDRLWRGPDDYDRRG